MSKLGRPKKKEVKANREFWRSNSFPLDRGFSLEDGDPSATFLDDTNFQIIISSSNYIPSLSHEHTASAQDENKGVNEMTLKDLSSLKRELYKYALHNMWHEAQPIFDKLRIPLTARGDTALHVAVMSANNITFVEGLVDLMTPEELERPNSDGNTAFCVAAISGNADCFQVMMQKNENIPLIHGQHGMLPVHLAALSGQHEIVQYLSSKNLLHKMAYKDIERLFFITVNSNMFDLAKKLFEEYPDLAMARDDQKDLTALHMLARRPSQEFYLRKNNQEGLELFMKLWSQVRELEDERILELITQPSAMLFDAVKSGKVEAVKRLLDMNPELVTIKDPNGLNLLHFAVLCQQRSIFYFLLKTETVNLILREMDNKHNNILHLAAHHQDESSLIWNIDQMRKKLLWLKEVEMRVPSELRTTRNIDGKTPNEIFYDEQKKFSTEAKDAAKEITKSGMVVAALIIAVAFAAALAVPRDKTNAWFIVFILTNAVALFTSSVSLLSFVSISTSSKFAKESEFIISVHLSLLFGLDMLYSSIFAMFTAFCAASILTLDHTSQWLAIVLSGIGLVLLLIYMFLGLQSSLMTNFIDRLFWVNYYLGVKSNVLEGILIKIYSHFKELRSEMTEL